MRSDFSSGRPPRYMSLSRSRISLPSGELKGMLRLLTEMEPETPGEKKRKKMLKSGKFDLTEMRSRAKYLANRSPKETC